MINQKDAQDMGVQDSTTPTRRSGRLMKLRRKQAFEEALITTTGKVVVNAEDKEDVDNKKKRLRNSKVAKVKADEAGASGEGKTRLRIRSPPAMLYFMMRRLTDEQKASITELGFDAFINFNISEFPTILAKMAVDSFNSVDSSMTVRGEKFYIDSSTIHDVLGVPMGKKKIDVLKSARMKEAVTKVWRTQFEKGMKRLYVSHVYDRMVMQNEGGDMFKRNFLVLFGTIMGKACNSGTVNQKFLPSMNDLEEVKNMDWCGYILDCLMQSKNKWSIEKHYNGPLTFLVVLYANKLQPKVTGVNAFGPIMNLWTTEDLSKLETDEVERMRYADLQPRQSKEIPKEIQVVYDTPEEHASKVGVGMERINNVEMRLGESKETMKEVNLEIQPLQVVYDTPEGRAQNVGVNMDDEITKEDYKVLVYKKLAMVESGLMELDEVLKTSLNVYPNSEFVDLRVLIQKITGFKEGLDHEVETKATEMKENDENGDDDAGVEGLTQFFKSPTVMKEIEQCESRAREISQQRSRMAFDDFETPSFSLGLTQQEHDPIEQLNAGIQLNDVGVVVGHVSENMEGNEKSKTRGNVEEKKQVNGPNKKTDRMKLKKKMEVTDVNDDGVKMGKEIELKGCASKVGDKRKRVGKPSEVMLSPFYLREVSLAEAITKDEQKVADCVFAARHPAADSLFLSNDEVGQRVTFESMIPGAMVVSGVIDIWCCILNYEEKKRNPMNVSRLFCKTNMLGREMKSVMDYDRNVAERFGKQMERSLHSTDYSSIVEVDLVFFPISNEDHWYVVCYDLKKEQIQILDHRKPNAIGVQGPYLMVMQLLTTLFAGYLKTVNHPAAKNMANPISKVVKMNWQTSYNLIDSGVFAMRHMEIYKGDGAGFDVGLKIEGPGQQAQLDELRIKFLAKMLLSKYNTINDSVCDEVKRYMKLPGFQRVKLKTDALDRIEKRISILI